MLAPRMLRVDPREPVIEEKITHLDSDIFVQIQKRQADYRTLCMQGHEHPLEIEKHHYQLVTVHRTDVDLGEFNDAGSYYELKGYSPIEREFFEGVMRRPEVEWAVDNSFDGIYILREEDMATFRTIYRFAVYLKKEQVTFWTLKYSGQ